MTVNRLHRPRRSASERLTWPAPRSAGRPVLGVATGVAGGAEAPAAPTSYEAVASAEGVRFSFGAPGFVAVDTFIDGGGPVSQSVIDGLGNSRAFASLPYPGDLAISGPGLLAGLTGLPSPPPYPFYVSSSHPTTPEAKVAQPGYELVATSAESSSQGVDHDRGQAGDGSSASAIGSTVTNAVTSRDAASGRGDGGGDRHGRRHQHRRRPADRPGRRQGQGHPGAGGRADPGGDASSSTA